MANLFILGAGGFGTALAVMTHAAGHRVAMWSYKEEEAAALRAARENTRLLPGAKIAGDIGIVTGFERLAEADFVLVAVPSAAVRSVAAQLRGKVPAGAVVVCVSKGFEQGSLKRMDEVLAEELPDSPIVILSGPSHAEEVAKGIPTTVVAACRDLDMAQRVQEALSNDAFRIYVTDDVVGVELGGALKNVIALAAGALDGLGLGDNTKAALMTRGLTEIARLGVACGILVGQGVPGAEAVRRVGMTVEGYTNAKNAYEMGRRLGVEMPITNEVYAVLYEGKDIRQAIADLMARPRRHESEYSWLKDHPLSL